MNLSVEVCENAWREAFCEVREAQKAVRDAAAERKMTRGRPAELHAAKKWLAGATHREAVWEERVRAAQSRGSDAASRSSSP